MTVLELHTLIGDQITRLCDTRADRATIMLEIDRSMALSSLARNHIRSTEVILSARNIAPIGDESVAHLII